MTLRLFKQEKQNRPCVNKTTKMFVQNILLLFAVSAEDNVTLLCFPLDKFAS